MYQSCPFVVTLVQARDVQNQEGCPKSGRASENRKSVRKQEGFPMSGNMSNMRKGVQYPEVCLISLFHQRGVFCLDLKSPEDLAIREMQDMWTPC
jgi:hypothetical protein